MSQLAHTEQSEISSYMHGTQERKFLVCSVVVVVVALVELQSVS
jgi:hypothetical protein